MLAYNPLGVPSATSEADNIIKRPLSSLYFQDFSEVPVANSMRAGCDARKKLRERGFAGRCASAAHRIGLFFGGLPSQGCFS